MENLENDFNDLSKKISDLESQIEKAKVEAEQNIIPLNDELIKIKADKTKFASKNDFASVEVCRRKENNLKFKISAQWNHYSFLKENYSHLKAQRKDLENQIKLKRDRIKRENEILEKMNLVLKNYKKTQNLKDSAADANINPDYTLQWLEWGKNDFSEVYNYFYTKILEIDKNFKNLESKKLKKQMDDVLEAYRLTNSLIEASAIVGVSFDVVQYWIEWGSKGFGEENSYFYRKFNQL